MLAPVKELPKRKSKKLQNVGAEICESKINGKSWPEIRKQLSGLWNDFKSEQNFSKSLLGRHGETRNDN